jgi:hypothetical protein
MLIAAGFHYLGYGSDREPCVKRVRTPLPGSEDGANVQEVIRERVRTHQLWTKDRNGIKAGNKCPGPPFLAALEMGGGVKKKARHETTRGPYQYRLSEENKPGGMGEE